MILKRFPFIILVGSSTANHLKKKKKNTEYSNDEVILNNIVNVINQ